MTAEVPEKARAIWRRHKSRVLAGKGNWLERMAYRALSGFVARHKARFGARDLGDVALWLMYHPEKGVLPCDGWTLPSFPPISPFEAAALAKRHADAFARVAKRLNLEDIRLADVRPAAVEDVAARRIAVHVHAFYPDCLPRIQKALQVMPVPFDLFISVPENHPQPSALPMAANCIVRPCPNRGRDIAPMICTFGGELAGYDYVAHFHTKKSIHELERRDWLDFLLMHLLGDAEGCLRIFALLERGYGMISAPDYLPMPEDPTGWMHNLPCAAKLAARGGLDVDLGRDYTPMAFPQGSMFWARGDFLKRFFSLPVSYGDFPPEPIGVDGSPAHALERMFFLWGAGTGLKVARLTGETP